LATDAIAAADADYSFPDGHCSSACNCCSSTVGLTVAHQEWEMTPPPAPTADLSPGGRREWNHGGTELMESMLIGIIAIRAGVLSSFSIDRDEVEDDDESDPHDARRLSKLCGDARLCTAWGIPEISCGPHDMSVSP
jgi:hypothetical protein